MKRSRTSLSSSIVVPFTVLAVCIAATVVNGGLNFRLPIPLISFYNPMARNKPPTSGHNHEHNQLAHRPSHSPLLNPEGHHRHRLPHNHPQTQLTQQSKPEPHHHYLTDHTHQDQQGAIYLHDPDSVVKFYYKENLSGHSNRVDIHHDGCREVPMDYWYQRPKSLWAKHCITLYASGHCKGEGVQVAGGVAELRSAGMHYGVNSFKPCEKNIRIRFMTSGATKHNKHHHHRHH